MRARNREVNIFNMSLLDILTGMLGAFLFLMLGLVPYYTRAKAATDKTPAVDTPLEVVARFTDTADLDVLLLAPDGGWHGADGRTQPISGQNKIDNDGCVRGRNFQCATTFGHGNSRYLLVFSLQKPADPETLRRIAVTTTLMETEIETDGSGIKSYIPLVNCSSFDGSGIRTGQAYADVWITISKDETKTDYSQQYDIKLDPVDDAAGLPAGVLPLPEAAAPATYAPAPSPGQVNPPQQPGTTAPPDNGPPPSGAPASPDTTPHKRTWFEYFFGGRH